MKGGTIIEKIFYNIMMICCLAGSSLLTNVNKTFSDYQEENDVSFIQMHISAGHPWAMKQIRDIVFGSEMLISIVIRDNTWIVPRGGTKLLPDDIIVLAAKPFDDTKKVTLREVDVYKRHAFAEYFAGQSYLAPISTDQVGIFNVTFEPGCRNNWHIHVYFVPLYENKKI